MKLTFLLIASLYFSIVLQAQVSKTFIVTAGGLSSSLTAEEKSTVTNLTLIGTIDARDFKTMRDDMPLLAEIDLSEVTILAYTGTEGTQGTSNFTYPSNTIPINAFYNSSTQMRKTSLTSFNFPLSTTSIGSSAFYYCSALSVATIPSSVATIGSSAFAYCSALTTVTIPSLVTTIDIYTFYHCKALKTVTIPSSVTTIGSSAFAMCSSLIAVIIPSSVTSIQNSFYGSSGDKIVDTANLNYSSMEGVLYNKAQTELIHCPVSKTEAFTIPSTVTSIGFNSFLDCKGLTSLTIPMSVTSIGPGSFWGCSGLTTINIPSSVTYIGVGTFSYCTKLSSFVFPSSVRSIEPGTLQNCSSLNSVTIPSSITKIGIEAFAGCTALSKIYANPVVPVNLSSSSNVFNNVNKTTCTLYVPFSSKAAYQVADQWKDFANIVEMAGIFLSANSVRMGLIADTAMVNITSSAVWTTSSDQTWLTVNPTSGAIGSDVLVFTTITNPTNNPRSATVTVSATGLESQTITVTQFGKVEVTPGNLKTLLTELLSVLSNLTLTGTIDARDFKTMRDEMPLLAKIDLSEVTILAYTGTEGTQGTSNFTYPSNTIPNYAFFNSVTGQGKISLTSFVFPSSVTTIGSYAFRYCSALKTVAIPSSITSIGISAFNYCSALKVVTIPSAITSIGRSAFTGCTGLSKIYANPVVPVNLSSSSNVFYNVNKTTCTLYVPFGSKAAYQVADQWKDFLNIIEMPDKSTFCQNLTLKSGWNIFSTPNQPHFAGMDTVFLTFMTNYSLVKIQDEEGNSMEDWGIYGGWKNNIGKVSPTEGYKVKVSKDDNFEICGTPVKYPFAIPLKSGWNIMGYPQTFAYDGLDVLQQLIDRGKLIKAQDEAGNSIEDWGIYGGWKNNIYDFIPGKGYNIKLSADDTLWINENYPKSSTILTEIAATKHFKTEFGGNGVDHMNINLVGLPINVLHSGDELAIFDGATCVGAVTIMPNHLLRQTASIAASARDNQGMPGFSEGNLITLKLWNSKQNTEFILEPEIVKGTSTFAKHETSIASLEKYTTTGLDGIFASEQSKINCYPNPFSNEVTVEINLMKDSEVKVEVLNQLGQLVKYINTGEHLNRGIHRLIWDGTNSGKDQAATGIYLIRMKLNEMVYYRKVVYSK